MKALAWCVVVGSVLFGAEAGHADPIIPNAGFELGNVDFTSGYTYQSNLVPPGTYYVDGESQSHNSNWTANVTPHSGNEFLIVNGDQNAGVVVYDVSGIAVLPDTQYYFGAWVTSLTPQSPAVLAFSINGSQIGSDISPSSTVGLWEQFYVPWYSGPSTTADISLVNENMAFTGNDFGLDDISLSTIQPIPEPLTLSLFGAGLLGLVVLRKKKQGTKI